MYGGGEVSRHWTGFRITVDIGTGFRITVDIGTGSRITVDKSTEQM